MRNLTVAGHEYTVRTGDDAATVESEGPAGKFMPPSGFASMLGINPYLGPVGLWWYLTKGIRTEADEAAYWGRESEDAIGRAWVRRCGNGDFNRWRKGRPWTVGSWLKMYPDWESIDGAALLEAKNVDGRKFANDWRDGVPLYFQCQAQPYLRVTGAGVCHFAVCGGGKTTSWKSVVDEIRPLFGSDEVDRAIEKHTTEQPQRRTLRPYFEE